MQTIITILSENSTPSVRELLGEHGLSMLIERGKQKILFDTGQGLAIANNLETLGKDLSNLDGIVLSHGHYDHTGGLLHALALSGGTKLYVHPDAFEPRYSAREDGHKTTYRDIGLPFSRQELISAGAEIMPISDFAQIQNGIFISGRVERPKEWRVMDERLVIKQGDNYVSDPLDDDMNMIVETESGPVLLLGCAHAGLEPIFSHMSSQGGWKEFHAAVGGTHLMAAKSTEELERAVELFNKFRVKVVAACHCTGVKASSYLSAALGDRFIWGHVGLSLTF